MDTAVTTGSVYGIIATLLIGLAIGFIANSIMGSGGVGLLWNIILGLVGSFVGNLLFSLLGFTTFGLVGQIIAGIIGACILIFAVRKLRHV